MAAQAPQRTMENKKNDGSAEIHDFNNEKTFFQESVIEWRV